MASLDGLTLGQSTTITFTDPTSGVQNFTILEAFESKEDAAVLKQISIDGVTRHPKLHQGWSGTVSFQRGSSFLDDYIAAQERNYYNGADQIDLSITQSISEVNGTVTQYQYTGVVLNLENAGNYSGTDIVKQSVSFMANRKQKLA